MRCTSSLRELRDGLRDRGLVDIQMSGSGSTLFVARESKAEADAALETARRALGCLPASLAAGVRTVRADALGSVLSPRPSGWALPAPAPQQDGLPS